MIELAAILIGAWIILVGLTFVLARLPERLEPLPHHPQPPPIGAIPLSMETAERMVERAYDRSWSRRVNGGELPHLPPREDAD